MNDETMLFMKPQAISVEAEATGVDQMITLLHNLRHRRFELTDQERYDILVHVETLANAEVEKYDVS